MSRDSYTFQFDTYPAGRGTERRTTYRRGIPVEQLLERFDQAADWVRAGTIANQDRPNLEKTLYLAYVWGPGVFKTPVNELSRPHIERVLEEQGLLAIDRPRIIALLWADLGDGYRAYKIRKSSEILEGFERPNAICYDLVAVEPDKTRLAFGWASERFWRDRGLWLGKPALLFSQHWQVTAEILKEIPQVAAHLPEGQAFSAPCALDWKGAERRDYPYIRPTRNTRKIREYRSCWPTAADVKWTPKELLIRRHGYGTAGFDPALALAL